MNAPADRHESFVLRIWRHPTRWRARLQDAADGNVHVFTSPEALSAFLGAPTRKDEPCRTEQPSQRPSRRVT
ncbi:MAG: hypothetical protein L0H84_14040 [Pseudonocardia sp.]|nr:hypothetical protein [Pseudonocardia sp.]